MRTREADEEGGTIEEGQEERRASEEGASGAPGGTRALGRRGDGARKELEV